MSTYADKYPQDFEQGKQDAQDFTAGLEDDALKAYAQESEETLQGIKQSVDTGLCSDNKTPLDAMQTHVLERCYAYYEGTCAYLNGVSNGRDNEKDAR